MGKGPETLAAAATLGAFIGAMASPAYADSGVYLGGYGGLNLVDDTDLDLRDRPGVTGDIDFDNGYIVGGVLGVSTPLGRAGGYYTLMGLRAEIDVNYRRNSVDALGAGLGDIVEGRTTDVSGNVNALSALANIWLDLNLGPLVPYAGGGVGMARISFDEVEIGDETVVDDRDERFVWQVGGGTALHVLPWTAVTLDYRYFVANGASFRDETGGELEMDYRSHSVMAGLRFTF